MHCAEFKVRLDAVVDQRRSPRRDPELDRHALHCPDCAEWMAAQNALLSAVGNFPSVEPRADFSFQVLQALEVRRRENTRRRYSMAAAAALAASLVIGVLYWNNQTTAPEQVSPTRNLDVRSIALLAQPTEFLANNLRFQELPLFGEVAQGFKPVTSSVYTALHALWRTVPGSDVAQTLL